MKLDELFEYIANVPIAPSDSKIFMIGASESDEYLNSVLNMSASEIAKFLYVMYTQNDVIHEAVDVLRLMVEEDMCREVVGEPVNTMSSDVRARAELDRALGELGAVIYCSSKYKS